MVDLEMWKHRSEFCDLRVSLFYVDLVELVVSYVQVFQAFHLVHEGLELSY